MKRTVSRGIYEDRYGYEVRWPPGGSGCLQRFPLDTPLLKLIEFRKRKLRQATEIKQTTTGSLARDIARFLKRRKRRPCYNSDRSHLKPWLARFKRYSRFDVTKIDIQDAIDAWTPKYTPREIRHRVKLLRQVYAWLDPSEKTPCDGVVLPKVKTQKRLPVSPSVFATVATNLLNHEKKSHGTRLRDAKTRARFLILALSGQRPIQLMRTDPATHVDLERRLWQVPPAKGDEGTIIALNEQLVAAWRLFIAAGAAGHYDTRSFSKTLKRNGWPADRRPYEMRHRAGQALRDVGFNLDDVQDQLGHLSKETTRTFYVSPSLQRLREMSAALDGLFPAETLAALPEPSTTDATSGNETRPDSRGVFARKGRQQKSRLRDRKITKTA
jgi:integrase